ncbi:hypothetical protein Tco_0730242 [Tanacetum coccineum]|uniref:Uncharacterized protein n=1 Tax=Tanacetum coccineum TaxID=301880 RepID=A0ABQ4YSC3_9ASTR
MNVSRRKPKVHYGFLCPSMKNLDDTYNFGDQFLYDKPTEDDQEKSKVIEESDSTIPDPTCPESIKNQESERFNRYQIKEQGEEKQDSTYSIRSTNKVAFKEFDLKSALFKHMNKNKTANRNPANHHIYHALMEALIADEDAMDKEVAVKLNLLRKMTTKVQRNHGSLMHLLPNNIQLLPQLDGRSLTQEDDDVTLDAHSQIPIRTFLKNPQITFQSRMKHFSDQRTPITLTFQKNRKKKLCKADLEGPAFNLVKAFYKNNVQERKIALSNPSSKPLIPRLALKKLVHLVVESEREYDISAAYGSNHCGFKKGILHQQHSEPSIVKQSDRRWK